MRRLLPSLRMRWRGRSFRLPRAWSNRLLRGIGPLVRGEVVNVSGWRDEDKQGRRYRDYFPNASSYTVTNHAGDRGLADSEDVTDLALDLTGPLDPALAGRFDVVFSHTTLEHVFEVEMAFANLCRLSRDLVIVVLPFAQEVHHEASYGDYWRFTPMGLRALFERNGLEVVFEGASPYRNAGIYLLFAGSRTPGRWRAELPAWSPVEVLGGWIGTTWPQRLRHSLRRGRSDREVR